MWFVLLLALEVSRLLDTAGILGGGWSTPSRTPQARGPAAGSRNSTAVIGLVGIPLRNSSGSRVASTLLSASGIIVRPVSSNSDPSPLWSCTSVIPMSRLMMARYPAYTGRVVGGRPYRESL